MKTKDIGSRIVADDVEVVLAARDLRKIDLSKEDRVLVEERSRQDLPQWADDRFAYIAIRRSGM